MIADRPPAVVIGLDSMQGIQTARILSGHGIDVIAIAADSTHHCCRTNCCREIHIANTQSEDFLKVLDDIALRWNNKPVLYPCQDEAVRVISRNSDTLEGQFRISLAEPDTIEMLSDKVAFYKYAQENNLPIAPTFILNSAEEAELAAKRIRFPAVLKPSARTRVWDRHTLSKAYRVNSADELLRLYEQCASWAPALVLQEWIPGGDDCLYSCNCYFGADANPLCTFVARKVRQWPPYVGVSSLGEECRNDFVLQETLKFFRGLGYRGLGYVEFKRDPGDGRHYLIEPNVGRPTGRSAIAEAGGVELLYTMYCDIVGLPVPKNRVQKYAGAKWVDIRHDFQSAVHYWRNGELTLGEWIKSWRGPKAHAYFSWKDPGPFLFDVLTLPKRALLRKERKKRDYFGARAASSAGSHYSESNCKDGDFGK